MPSRVLILDISVLCCLLQIPGKETCGTKDDLWSNERVEKLLEAEKSSTLVLPLAAIIEAGNHIAQAPTMRFEIASKLSGYIAATANGTTPWAAFTEQNELWAPDRLIDLATKWPTLAARRLSMGDVTMLPSSTRKRGSRSK